MRMTRLARASLVAFLSLGFVACASGGGSMDEGPAAAAGEGIPIQVNNDYVPSAQVVVWMVPESGSRRRLGTIPPNGRSNFRYVPTDRSMDHRLSAEVSGGGTEQTNPFTLTGVTEIRWDVSNLNATLIR